MAAARFCDYGCGDDGDDDDSDDSDGAWWRSESLLKPRAWMSLKRPCPATSPPPPSLRAH